MSTTYSYLHRTLRTIRDILDVAETSAKFPDSTLMTDYVPTAYDNVMSRLGIDNPNQVVGEFDLSISESTEFYEIPSCVKSILSVFRTNSGYVIEELPAIQLSSRSQYGWMVQGNMLRVVLGTKRTDTFRVRYVPGGMTYPHYGSSTGLALVGTDRLGGALSSSPTLGVLEPRPSGYVGQMLRVFVGSQVYERVIKTYVPSDRSFDLELAAPEGVPNDSTTVAYEVVPSELGSVANCVAMNVALTLSTALRINPNQTEQIRREYAQSLKTAFETLHLRTGYRGVYTGTERRFK